MEKAISISWGYLWGKVTFEFWLVTKKDKKLKSTKSILEQKKAFKFKNKLKIY